MKGTIEHLSIEKQQELITEVEALRAENEALHAINKDLTLEIEEIKAGPEKPLADGLVSKLTFDADDITYGFKIAAVNLDGRIVSAEDVVSDKDLQAKLIKRKSGMLAVIAD